ncbi:MAG: FAD-dependent oxidoreductase [Spirochaetota bacterium]
MKEFLDKHHVDSNTAKALTIRVGMTPYRMLGEAIRSKIAEGINHFILENVMGQRYIGAGLRHGVLIEMWGVPGQDLGVFNDGAKLVVYGNAQDGVGNTMNDGFIIIHGNVGDIPGHMMRDGKIYIRGSAGFRAGIMMKEYGPRHPVMIIGERIGDYPGEYMAGGTIVVLGYSLGTGDSPVGRHVASGMFGGEIYIRGRVDESRVGKGAVMSEIALKDLVRIMPYLEEYAGIFNLDMKRILDAPFTLIRRAGGRPYGNLYVPSSKIARDFKPVHRNITPPCANACPIGIPNPIIIRKLREGKVTEAFEIIDDYTPFRYSCCGMVCPGLCRSACTRGMLDEPVKIDEIARIYHPVGEVKILEGKKPERICIIGAGPAGLSAAWHLARRGYEVDVYEKESNIGGKLVHNVPETRLPYSEVEKDLFRIRSVGIKFITGTEVDKKLFQNLKKQYDSVIIAVGTQRPRTIGFSGEVNAISASSFLRTIKITGQDIFGVNAKSVVIIGAGNVAMDVACECFRLNAASVTVIDIKKPSAFGKELEKAIAYGTKILFPRFVDVYEDGILRMKNGEELKADLLIESVGELPELDFVGEKLLVDRDSFTTNLPHIYVIGDAVAPGLVTHSIAMGRSAALHIHGLLRGFPTQEERELVVDKRKVNVVYFQEKEGFYDLLDTCFSCGTCLQCDICVEHCPRGAISRMGEIFTVQYELCSGCGVCASLCPRNAIIMEPVSLRQETGAD